MQIAVAKAKARLPEVIRRAEAGETVEFTRYGRTVARIVVTPRPVGRPLIGAMKGTFAPPESMFPGDDEIASLFGHDQDTTMQSSTPDTAT